MVRSCLVVLLFTIAVSAAARADAPSDKIDFNRDIRPILSENCVYCHGPDKAKRKADLRLDTQGGLFDEIDKAHPVVPGKVAESDLFRRITTDDADEKMPPAKSNKKLTAEQIAKIKQWIEQGAPWKGHWAYIKPTMPALPAASDWAQTPIDQFIAEGLAAHGLQAGEDADRVTLCRRLYFDLLGLPPSPGDVKAFVTDKGANAYEALVDKLLADRHFGERMAVSWLDQVRYADTIGYHSDNPMNVSPYRDWVIAAFNENMPFDQFTIEQLAGDMLPNATTAQRVASCYNRLLQTTGEGGAQAKEYIAKYASDRVRNVSAVWMAQTMGCCECHDHKFDPLATREFYNMEAFFADIQEAAIAVREPGMPVPTGEQAAKLAAFDKQLGEAKAKLNAKTQHQIAAELLWEVTTKSEVAWKVAEPTALAVQGGSKLTNAGSGVLRTSGTPGATEDFQITLSLKAGTTAVRLEALPDEALPGRGPGTAASGNFVLSQFTAAGLTFARASADHAQDQFPIASTIDPTKKGNRNSGWAILPAVGQPHAAVFELSSPLAKDQAVTFTLSFQSQYAQHSLGKLRLSTTDDAEPSRAATPPLVRAALEVRPEKRTAEQKKTVDAYFRAASPELKPARDAVAKVDAERNGLLAALPTCLVSTSGPARTVRVLPRGNWMDETGPITSPGVPAVLNKLVPADPKHATRLDLAHWVVSRDNPLTARVFVNRLWKTFYGAGIARKVDDFGSQGDWPSHPELLDYLAVDLMDHGWDIKRSIKAMVMSHAYRETSVPTATQTEKDPANVWLSHQARFRLDAEFVRDNALAISGLLADKLGGRSVFPYQPAGYWSFLNFPPREWQDDKGDGLYRRGLYTHWQRTFLQPSLLAFDAPSREEAVCERTKSNVPQQALAMLNDVTYVEASRVFAEKIVKSGPAGEARMDFAFHQALQRSPRPAELSMLNEMLAAHLKEYAGDEASARKLIAIGDAPAPADVKPAELAAWTNVARVILNLHETITRN